MNTDKAVKELLKQVAALTAKVEGASNAPAPKAAKAKQALWETVAEKRIAAKGAKVGRVVTHGRIGGKDYVAVGKTVGGKTVKSVAVPAADLKAALAGFDL